MKIPHVFPILLLSLLLAACGGKDDHVTEDGHGDDHATAEVAKGSHNGRLLTQGRYTVELAIFEEGIPPEYRAWLYRDSKPIAPTAGRLTVVLKRLGLPPQTQSFKVQEDFLRSTGEVVEPHSFDVEVAAVIDGQSLRWTFDSYEGRTVIGTDVAKQAGIVVAPASSGTIRDEHEVQGLLTPIEGRHARIVARFPGPVRSVGVGVGDVVKAGQVLATVESNTSLSNYPITAPFAGVVLARNAGPGDLAGDAPLFEIADLSRLWVDLHVFGADAQHITPGLPVEVMRLSDNVSAVTILDRVLPGTATASQSTVARATITNSDGLWRPGAAVRARVTVSEEPVALRVPLAALQRFRDWDVVFIRLGDTFEIRPLTLGRRDGKYVEVLEGLKAGDPIVVEQSYVVKADIEKSGASHDH